MGVGNLSGYVKIDCALPPSTWGAAVTSEYYKMDKYEKVIFITEVGSGIAATGTVTASIVSAYSNTGGGSAVVGVYTTMGAATANTVTKAKAVVIDNASSWDAGETITINDVVYTMASTSSLGSSSISTGSFSTNRYVYSSSGMTHAAGAVEHLAALINHATYGVAGLTAIPMGSIVATASCNNVYIYASGDKTITAAASATDIQVIPCRYDSILECRNEDLLISSSHQYVAVTMTPSSATAKISAVCIRSGARYADGNTGTVSDYDLEAT